MYPDCGPYATSASLAASTNGASVNVKLSDLLSETYNNMYGGYTNRQLTYFSEEYLDVQRTAGSFYSFYLQAPCMYTNHIVICLFDESTGLECTPIGSSWSRVGYEEGLLDFRDSNLRLHIRTQEFPSTTYALLSTNVFAYSPSGPGVFLGFWLSATPISYGGPSIFDWDWFSVIDGKAQEMTGGDDIFNTGFTMGQVNDKPFAFRTFGVPTCIHDTFGTSPSRWGVVETYRMFLGDAPVWHANATFYFRVTSSVPDQVVRLTSIYYAP
jgi:hypothetical protein